METDPNTNDIQPRDPLEETQPVALYAGGVVQFTAEDIANNALKTLGEGVSIPVREPREITSAEAAEINAHRTAEEGYVKEGDVL